MGRWIFYLSFGLLLLGPPLERIGAAAQGTGLHTLDRDRADRTFEDLERQLKQLLQELRKLEKEAGEKLRNELIPMLKKEIERLRKWLREFKLKEKSKPVWTWNGRHPQAELPVGAAGTG